MYKTMPDEFGTFKVLFLSPSPQVVSGDPSEKGQDGFPITHVGNDCDGDGFPIHVILIDRLVEGCWRHNVVVQCLNGEISVFTV